MLTKPSPDSRLTDRKQMIEFDLATQLLLKT